MENDQNIVQPPILCSYFDERYSILEIQYKICAIFIYFWRISGHNDEQMCKLFWRRWRGPRILSTHIVATSNKYSWNVGGMEKSKNNNNRETRNGIRVRRETKWFKSVEVCNILNGMLEKKSTDCFNVCIDVCGWMCACVLLFPVTFCQSISGIQGRKINKTCPT